MIQTRKCIHKKESERDMLLTKKCVFREKLRCDALDIKVRNLVHKQDVPYEKMTRESDVSILKRLYLSDISCGT